MDFRKNKHRSARMRGITLVEVVTASFIFAIVVVGSATMFVMAKRQVQNELRRRQAIQLASSRLEELKAGDYDAIVLGTEPNTLTVDGHTYNRETVTTLESSSLFKNVTVSISWDRTGHTYSVALDTIIGPK